MSLTSTDEVAATTRKVESRSALSNSRAYQASTRALSHVTMAGVACGATTRTLAPATSRLRIFDSAIFPAPITRHERPFSFRNIGKRLIPSPFRTAHLTNPPDHAARDPEKGRAARPE